MAPKIGIWWDDGSLIVSFLDLPGEPDRSTGLCDSDYTHNELWPEAAMRLAIDEVL